MRPAEGSVRSRVKQELPGDATCGFAIKFGRMAVPPYNDGAGSDNEVPADLDTAVPAPAQVMKALDGQRRGHSREKIIIAYERIGDMLVIRKPQPELPTSDLCNSVGKRLVQRSISDRRCDQGLRCTIPH